MDSLGSGDARIIAAAAVGDQTWYGKALGAVLGRKAAVPRREGQKRQGWEREEEGKVEPGGR